MDVNTNNPKIISVGIASDHAGFELKKYILTYFSSFGFVDYGTDSSDKSVNYPVFAHKICNDIIKGNLSRGILICGSGVGMCIAANKFHIDIIAALCHDEMTAKLSRQHNNSNILCLGAWMTSAYMSRYIIESWLSENFSNDERHIDRLNLLKQHDKIDCKYE